MNGRDGPIPSSSTALTSSSQPGSTAPPQLTGWGLVGSLWMVPNSVIGSGRTVSTSGAAKGPERRDQRSRLHGRPQVGDPQMRDEPSTQRGRDHLEIREGDHRHRQRQIIRCSIADLGESGQHLGGNLAGKVQSPTLQGRPIHEIELELGRHPEVAAAAPDGPEQVRIPLAVTSRSSPSGVTRRIRRTWSAAQPCRLPTGPTPPPRVYATTPTLGADPQTGTRPSGAHCCST